MAHNDRRHKLVLGVLPLLLLVVLLGCDVAKVTDSMERIPDQVWKRTLVVGFPFTITDTNGLYNVYIQVRNTTDYPYSNLYLFLETQDPQGIIYKDTVSCKLAEPDGKWTGKGMGKIRENRVLFKKGMRWPKAGTYSIRIEQAMRTEALQGISDMGIRIEKE